MKGHRKVKKKRTAQGGKTNGYQYEYEHERTEPERNGKNQRRPLETERSVPREGKLNMDYCGRESGFPSELSARQAESSSL